MRENASRSTMLFVALGMALIMLLGSAGVAQALMLELSLEGLTDGADCIILGTVIETSSHWNADHTSIYTEVVVAVEESLKGPVGTDTMMIVVPGGTVGEIGQYVSDTPDFATGERAVLFLQELTGMHAEMGIASEYVSSPVFLVYGQYQGKLSIRDGVVGAIPAEELKGQISQIIETGGSLPGAELADREANVVEPAYVYGGMKWFGTSPIVSYKVNATSARNTAVQNAAASWTNAGAKFSFSYGGTHSRTGESLDNGINEIMWYDLGAGDTLALTTTWYYTATGQIVDCDMVFNTRYTWSTSSGDYDVQTVALHEFGHFLYLGHSSVSGATMREFYTGTDRTLHSDDIAGIKYIYGASCSVSTPSTPSGSASGQTGTSYSYSTGGSTCAAGHSVQYRFDWGDGTFSSWSSSTSASKSWSSAGTYNVKAQARCATNTEVTSSWSSSRVVTISTPCSVSTPSTPSGSVSGQTSVSYSYSTGGSTCAAGHSVEYNFDWGDGTFSSWSSSTSASKSWSSPGTYSVRAQARCATNNSVLSAWSPVTSVTIRVPPTITTLAATNVASTTATLNMSYTLGGYAPSDVRFAYKRSADSTWTETAWVSRSSGSAYAESLSGLDPATEYTHRAELRYDSTILQGDILSVTTLAPQPDIIVSPRSFEVTVSSGATLDCVLTISNSGIDSLIYGVCDMPTGGSPTFAQSTAVNSVLRQTGQRGEYEALSSSTVVPCSPSSGAPGEGTNWLVYDDGVAEDAWAGALGVAWAVKFTPISYPVLVKTTSVCLWPDWPDADHEEFGLDVYDDDASAGAPGTVLGGVNNTATEWGWSDIDLSGLGLTITYGDFYVAYWNLSSHPDAEGVCFDMSSPDGRSWCYFGGGWTAVETTSITAGDWMIRCELQDAGCPWLSESPASSSVAPAHSQEVILTIDATGLDVGDYGAQVVVDSNDPDENHVIVPVTLHVTAAPPVVDTGPISDVEETSATDNGFVVSSGGENCDLVGACWSTLPGPNINATKNEVSGSFGAGPFGVSMAGLSEGTTYYARAYAHNSAGYGYGHDVSFTTKPDEPLALAAVPDPSIPYWRINLSWAPGDGATRTYVRGRKGSLPSDISDGYLVYDGNGATCCDSRLDPSSTYYYRAWSWVEDHEGEDLWSDASCAASAATDAAPPMEDFDIVVQPGWNMVSVPVQAADMSANVIFAGAVAIYTWDSSSKSYVVPPEIESENGYWVAVTETKTITVTGIPVAAWSSSIYEGWNMIGSVMYDDPVGTDNLTTDATPDPLVRNAIYRWNPSNKSYESVTSIQSGEGCWLATTETCEVAFAPPT